MIPAEFDYYAPTSVQEAIGLLQEKGPEAKLLAGGHSLVPLMKLRLAAPSVLIDLNRIAELRGIRSSDGGVAIGAMTTHSEVESSPELADRWPIFHVAGAMIGDPMVRHRGTIGGSLAHADPAGDWPAVALALDARMHIAGPNGERVVPAGEFFVDMLTSALEPDEVLTEIEIPALEGRVGMAYEKFRHPASGYAVVGVAAVVVTDGSGSCQDCRVAITGAGPKATRATGVEEALKGRPLDEQSISAAAERAGEGMAFLGDIYASEEYREHLTKVYTKRALLAAARSAQG